MLFFLLIIGLCKTGKCQEFVYKPTRAIETYDKPIYNDDIKDTITLKLVKITDVRVFNLIDTVLQASEKCFFIKDNQPILYTFYVYRYGDTLKIHVSVGQYDELYYLGYTPAFRTSPTVIPYFFSYKDNYFFVKVFSLDDIHLNNRFYKITNIEKKFNIKFGEITNYYISYNTHSSGVSDGCLYIWDYIDGNFYLNFKRDCVPDSIWLDPTIDRYKNGEKLNNTHNKPKKQ